MLPAKPMHYVSDCGDAKPQVSGGLRLIQCAVGVTLSEVHHLFWRQLGSVVSRGEIVSEVVVRLTLISVFLLSVSVVVGNCAKEQVLRVTARWVVAFVEHAQSAWNWAIGKLPCGAMGLYQSGLAVLASACDAVALIGFVASPRPASIFVRRGDVLMKVARDSHGGIIPRPVASGASLMPVALPG